MSDLISRQQPVARGTNVLSNDTVSRQAAVDELNKMKIYRPLDSDRYVISDCLNKIVNLPSAQPELPSYVAEIEEEYQKAVKSPYIHKPLAKALYEVWKKHDREDAERRTDEQDSE